MGQKDVIKEICENKEYSSFRKAQLAMVEIIKEIDRICKKHDLIYWLDSGTLLGTIRHGGFIPWDDDGDLCMPREDYNKFLKVVEKELPPYLTLESEKRNLHKKLPWTRILYMENFKWKLLDSEEECMGLSIDIFPMDLVERQTVNKSFVNLLKRICSWNKPKAIRGLKDLIRILLGAIDFKKFWLSYVKKQQQKGNAKYYCYGIETSFTNERYLFSKEDVHPLKTGNFEGVEFNIPNNHHSYLTNLYGDYMKLPPEEERVTHCTGFDII